MKNSEKIILQNGLKLYRKGEFKNALKYFNKLTNELKNYYIGITYVRLGEYEKAVKSLMSYVQTATDYNLMIQVFLILGYIYSQLGDNKNALKFLEKCIKLDFNNSKAYAAMGYVYYQLKKYDEAIDSLKKAIEIDNNNATAHNSLGYIYGDLNIDLEKALKEVEVALKLKPEYGAFLDSIGWIYYKKGDIINAKRYLSKALEKLPDNEEIKKHFRDVVVKEIASRKEKID